MLLRWFRPDHLYTTASRVTSSVASRGILLSPGRGYDRVCHVRKSPTGLSTSKGGATCLLLQAELSTKPWPCWLRLLSFWTEMEETWRSLYLYPLPTVAAINGSSPAWGPSARSPCAAKDRQFRKGRWADLDCDETFFRWASLNVLAVSGRSTLWTYIASYRAVYSQLRALSSTLWPAVRG